MFLWLYLFLMIFDHQIWNINDFLIFKKILRNQFDQSDRFIFRVLFFFMFETFNFNFRVQNFLIFFWTFNSFDCCKVDFIRIDQNF